MRSTFVRVVVLLLAFSSCGFLTGGGGGGGGGGEVDFARGMVHVRRDDRNLYVADEKNYSQVWQLTQGGGAYTPSLSRDGRVVVFIARTTTDTTIATIPANGGTVSSVYKSSSTVRNLRTPVFTPDGKEIVFAYDESSSSSIGKVALDGSGFVKLGGGGTLSHSSPSILPNGDVLVAAGSPSSGYDQIQKLTTNGTVDVVMDLGNDALDITTRVVVSPDGRLAAFDGRLGSGSSRIFVLDLTSRVVTQLTDYPSEPNATDTAPAWVGSANIAFSSTTGGADQTYVLAADKVKTSGGLTIAKAIEPWYGPN